MWHNNLELGLEGSIVLIDLTKSSNSIGICTVDKKHLHPNWIDTWIEIVSMGVEAYFLNLSIKSRTVLNGWFDLPTIFQPAAVRAAIQMQMCTGTHQLEQGRPATVRAAIPMQMCTGTHKLEQGRPATVRAAIQMQMCTGTHRL